MEKKNIFVKTMKKLLQFYNIENLEAEIGTWYDLWKNKDCGVKVNLSHLSKTVFPSLYRIMITTCSVETHLAHSGK